MLVFAYAVATAVRMFLYKRRSKLFYLGSKLVRHFSPDEELIKQLGRFEACACGCGDQDGAATSSFALEAADVPGPWGVQRISC